MNKSHHQNNKLNNNKFTFNFPFTVPPNLNSFRVDIHTQSPPRTHIMIGTTVEFTAILNFGDLYHWLILFADGQSMSHIHRADVSGDPFASSSFKVQHRYNSVSADSFFSVLKAYVQMKK